MTHVFDSPFASYWRLSFKVRLCRRLSHQETSDLRPAPTWRGQSTCRTFICSRSKPPRIRLPFPFSSAEKKTGYISNPVTVWDDLWGIILILTTPLSWSRHFYYTGYAKGFSYQADQRVSQSMRQPSVVPKSLGNTLACWMLHFRNGTCMLDLDLSSMKAVYVYWPVREHKMAAWRPPLPSHIFMPL